MCLLRFRVPFRRPRPRPGTGLLRIVTARTGGGDFRVATCSFKRRTLAKSSFNAACVELKELATERIQLGGDVVLLEAVGEIRR